MGEAVPIQAALRMETKRNNLLGELSRSNP